MQLPPHGRFAACRRRLQRSRKEKALRCMHAVHTVVFFREDSWCALSNADSIMHSVNMWEEAMHESVCLARTSEAPLGHPNQPGPSCSGGSVQSILRVRIGNLQRSFILPRHKAAGANAGSALTGCRWCRCLAQPALLRRWQPRCPPARSPNHSRRSCCRHPILSSAQVAHPLLAAAAPAAAPVLLPRLHRCRYRCCHRTQAPAAHQPLLAGCPPRHCYCPVHCLPCCCACSGCHATPLQPLPAVPGQQQAGPPHELARCPRLPAHRHQPAAVLLLRAPPG